MPPKKQNKKDDKTLKQAKDNFQRQRGMRDIIDEEFYLMQGFFEKAADIASYYGFKPIDTPVIEDEGVFVRTAGESSDIVEKEMFSFKLKTGPKLALKPEFTAGIMRAYIENGMQSLPQPVQLYTFGPLYRHDRPQKGRYRDHRQFDLEIIGTEKSVADAMIIHIVNVLLKEVGLTNIFFAVNSMGDKESRNSYIRELTNYYKKHLSSINKNCEDCARRFKTNPLRLLDCKNETCMVIQEDAPETVSFLNESSKRHFKELLEYLETLKIEYTIDGRLVRGLDYYTHTVFEIFLKPEKVTVPETAEGEVPAEVVETKPLALGGGGRYDGLAKQLGSKKDVPSVGAGLGVDRIIEAIGYNRPTPRIVKKPKVFFIQLGYEAKLKSLSIIEIIRHAKVPVRLSVSKDSLSSQLGTAERLKIPYAILLGQKEVMENTVILRNMKNRSQKTISIEKLSDELKKLK